MSGLPFFQLLPPELQGFLFQLLAQAPELAVNISFLPGSAP